MTYVRRYSVAVTTDGSGDATVYSDEVNGRIIDIQYVKSTFANGSTFLITSETTGKTIWSESNVDASATRAPRQPTHDNLGAASLYAAGGEPVEDHIYLAQERIKIVISAGGATKAGTFRITVA